MASELWGAAAGLQQLIQTQDSHALTQLQLEEGNVHMEFERQQIQQSQDVMQRQKLMLQNIGAMQAQWGKEKRPDNMDQMTWETQQRALHLGQMSEEYAKEGFPDQAATFANTASEMQYRQAEVRKNDAELKIQQWRHGLDMMGTITSQETLDDAIRRFPQETGSPSPIAPGTRYTPQLMDQIRSMGLNSLQLAEKTAAEAQAEQYKAAAEMDRAHAEDYRSMARWNDEGRPTMSKALGAAAVPKAPTSGEIAYITSKAEEIYNPGTTNQHNKAQIRDAATAAADTANGLMREAAMRGESLTWKDAMDKAFALEQAAGGFVGIPQKAPKQGTISGEPLQTPMVKNAKGEFAVNEHAIKANQWYMMKRKDEKEAQSRLAMLQPDGSFVYRTQAELDNDLRVLKNNARPGVTFNSSGAAGAAMPGKAPNYDLSKWATPPQGGVELPELAKFERLLQAEQEDIKKYGHNSERDRQLRVLEEAIREIKSDEGQQ